MPKRKRRGGLFLIIACKRCPYVKTSPGGSTGSTLYGLNNNRATVQGGPSERCQGTYRKKLCRYAQTDIRLRSSQVREPLPRDVFGVEHRRRA